MTSGLVVDEFDLNLSSAGLLVSLWPIVVVVVVGTVARVIVVDKPVVGWWLYRHIYVRSLAFVHLKLDAYSD